MTARTNGLVSLFGHDPETYRPHPLHSQDRTYPETNCYADVLIELLHARGDESLAALGITVRQDFEGDQWTFFKPPPDDLEGLFGIDIHEMQPYRPLPVQIEELLGMGRTMIVELDAWYLPDTASTSYRTEHVKTSVAVEAIDTRSEVLRYYHNTSLHELRDEDYRGVFRSAGTWSDDVLPPYAEIARFDAGTRLAGDDLRAAARERLRIHLGRVLPGNPFDRFAQRFGTDLPGLLDGDAAAYHAYAFATVRMAGAGFELCAAHVDWVLGSSGEGASNAFGRIVEDSKILGFKLARRRPFDPGPTLASMADAWSEGIASLDDALR